MTTKEDVERFLNQFHEKLKIYNIFFRDDREKNLQTLTELEITSNLDSNTFLLNAIGHDLQLLRLFCKMEIAIPPPKVDIRIK